MAVIKPFRGMRFDTEKAGELKTLCCPPYDIISEEQRKAFIAQNPYNVIRLELPKEGDDVYERAGEVLDLWRDKGVLVYEDKPAIYVYEMEFNALNLMKATNCNFSQIYALYMDSEHTTLQTIDAESTADAAYAFTDDDNITHRLWVVTDEKVIEKLCADFADRKLYIADGHHRYETALNYRNYCRENGISKEGDGQDYQMIYLVDMEHPGLVVFPTHRMVRDLPDFSKYNVLAGCEPYFEIEKYTAVGNMNTLLAEKYNQGKKAFAFYCGKGEWYLLTLKDIGVMSKVLPDVSEASQQLDVSVLHSLILEKTMGIDKENMANQINLTYTKFFEEAIVKVDKGQFQCSFILNPTRVTEIRDVAAAGEKMPQKSTYFYPKMITGMVMNDIGVE